MICLDNAIKRIFDGVCADDSLRGSAYAAVCREISGRREKVLRPKSRASAVFRLAAGCVAAFVVMLGGYSLCFAEDSYVSIDVNPSVELGLNRFERVVSVTAYNAEGSKVISGEQLMYKPYASAVTMVLERVKASGYAGGDAYVTFTVQSSGGEQREQSILGGLHGCASELAPDSRVEYTAVGKQTRLDAKSNGMTAGKYLAALELQSLDPAVTLDDCRGFGMGEIKKRTAECHAMNAGNGNGNGNRNGNGSGNRNGNGNGCGNGGNGHGGHRDG